MKIVFIFLISLVFFIGCAEKNAFSRFNMDKQQELSANSIQSSKIKAGNFVEGVVSVVYLNEVYPKSLDENENFYVFTYVKDKNTRLKFLLNNIQASSIKILKAENAFTYLTSIDAKWNHYYLVQFPKQKDILTFVLESGQSSSDPLVFEKDE